MKKILIIALALMMALAVVACGDNAGQSSSPIVGTWVLTKGKVMGFEVSAADVGVNMSFDFKANGKASMTNDGETVNGLNWKMIDDSTVQLSAFGSSEKIDLEYDGSTLLMHETNSGADLIFEKK